VSDDNSPVDDSQLNWVQEVLQGGLPQIVLGKHVSKALGRLIGGIADVPVAACHNFAQRIRDDTDARRRVKAALVAAALKAVRERPELGDQALAKWAPGDLRAKQLNREAVAAKVIEKLADDPPSPDLTEGPADDFMNLYEDVAERASSENLRDLLARILAGEIRKPRSFSLQTLQLASVVDQRLANAITRASVWATDNFFPIVGPLKYDQKLAILDELADAGLLRSGSFSRQFARSQEGTVTLSFPWHDIVLTVVSTDVIQILAAPLTRTGREIMALLPPLDDEEALADIQVGLAQDVPGVTDVRIVRRILSPKASTPPKPD
jgi:hypothetical protein